MSKRLFESGGGAYWKYRPDYPPQLAALLAELAPKRNLAVDVGCGSGQLAVQLAGYFDKVAAFDISPNQIANAALHPRVTYTVAPAEELPVDDSSQSLITAAQAAHWFDLPGFYAEARRIAAPQAVIALVTYSVPVLEGPAGRPFRQCYDDLEQYWPPERYLVESGYADLPFPFEELDPPAMNIERVWTFPELIGYVETWSATKRARTAGAGIIVDTFIADARELCGGAQSRWPISWPIQMRLGRVT